VQAGEIDVVAKYKIPPQMELDPGIALRDFAILELLNIKTQQSHNEQSEDAFSNALEITVARYRRNGPQKERA
jgi:hypothetical protein